MESLTEAFKEMARLGVEPSWATVLVGFSGFGPYQLDVLSPEFVQSFASKWLDKPGLSDQEIGSCVAILEADSEEMIGCLKKLAGEFDREKEVQKWACGMLSRELAEVEKGDIKYPDEVITRLEAFWRFFRGELTTIPRVETGLLRSSTEAQSHFSEEAARRIIRENRQWLNRTFERLTVEGKK